MLKRKNISLYDDTVGFVSDLTADIKVEPSEKLFFDQYLYRLELLCQTRTKKEVRNFKFGVMDYCEENFTYKIRTHFSKSHKFLYVSDFEDLNVILNSDFEPASVTGPINQQHYELLYTRDYRCEVRDKLYYNKYDCKVSIWPVRKKGGGWSLLGSIGNNEFQYQKSDFLEFIKENADCRFNIKSYTYVDHDFYVQQQEFSELLPFIKLQYPDLRFIVTGCIVK